MPFLIDNHLNLLLPGLKSKRSPLSIMLSKNKVKTEQSHLKCLAICIYCSFLLLVQKKRTKRKRHPAAWPAASLTKLRSGALPETRFAQRGPATFLPGPAILLGCAAWDKKTHWHNNENRLVEIWNGKVTFGSLMASYYHAFFGAKAGANGLCGFSAIIDMLSKNDFWTLYGFGKSFCCHIEQQGRIEPGV